MLYTGIDLIEIARIAQAVERWGPRFLQRVFTPHELADCHVTTARGAAKEAAAKALGVGLRGLGAQLSSSEQPVAHAPIGWHEVEIVRAPGGRPLVQLHGDAAALAIHLGITELALSLSHTRDHAIASVVGLASYWVETKSEGLVQLSGNP